MGLSGNGSLAKIEAFLRLSSILALVLTAAVVGFDTETEVVMYTVKKRATYGSLDALLTLVYVASVAAGYNLLQLICKSSFLKGSCSSSLYMAWACLLLDQAAVYVTFGANTAAAQASLLAVTGAEAFQWMKLCNKFTRFCVQIGGALLCGYAASLLMLIISYLSAFRLFRLYSPKWFLRLKAK